MYNKNEVEAVKNCYYCNSNNIKVKYENVHDFFGEKVSTWSINRNYIIMTLGAKLNNMLSINKKYT